MCPRMAQDLVPPFEGYILSRCNYVIITPLITPYPWDCGCEPPLEPTVSLEVCLIQLYVNLD